MMGPVIGIAALVGGAALTAIGQIQSANAQAAGQRTQARLSQIEAREVGIRTAEETRLAQRRLRLLRGEQQAGFAASGVVTSEGTPLLIDIDTELEGERQIALNERASLVEQSILNAQADQFRRNASASRTSGFLRAGGTAARTAATLLGGTSPK